MRAEQPAESECPGHSGGEAGTDWPQDSEGALPDDRARVLEEYRDDPDKIGRNYYFGRTLSTCAVHDGLVFAAEQAGYLHCLDAKTGQRHWVHDTKGAIHGNPLVVGSTAYIADEEGIVSILTLSTAKQLIAKREAESTIVASPVYADGVLYVLTERRLFAVSSK